ncbi:1-phosphatidylinositol 4,5-bisphosphate phosphodiesterase delta-4-like [Hippoglossus hippoglossus]|uniref:1-phosphatidylinositol 4,5-bisphosphate phosphodiesterase delta-4-like n=1 Tax=Hippoglossus hippoglossus TaxID=8267 RepID=UPI00148DC211|nr:1-phosphatidylinositol 4,5-bisphosphate phosphodiesterase delta-4-like [Hippoglossus hippoglossus]XP_034429465.1 1-phosphatidylinositol 4,5-bisphosphate phosphodiesterase delta-4-like [Hippoglossus hippoglossus]XP_035030299.1 1-phosphatidylinositol 4,5-bisphosphate phosphodiesterase delta-4 [Hippoglossus stenolepis]XP_035030300.1 1-phosphatidylinositol 4,5-bisphosphate phosphodiesterase delta-4 [Hippoglossus stenolepis]
MDPEGSHIRDDPHVKVMMAGSTLRKVKSRSWKKPRHFRLLEDGLTIWYKSRWAGKGHSTFSVTELEAVREGHQSEVLLSIAEEFPADLCFTLVFHGRQGNLDLVADSPEEARAWIQGVRKLIHKAQTMDEKERLDQWVWDWFQKADKNKDGKMNFKEVRKLLKMMNVDMNEEHALHLFTMADKSESGSLEIEQFVHFYKILTQRDEVWKVFQDYSGDGEKLLMDELESFLRMEQHGGERSAQNARELIDRYEPSETAKKQGAMSLDGFQMYLCSQEGSIFNPEHQGLHQDMSQPLSHYFISSSHNTYLLENQLRGHSSLEAYIQALKRGCRCVELDSWDGSDGEPVVYHGHTLTSKILFRDIISTLKEYAFKASDFPVILSLENHCGVEQQALMAQHLRQILGDTLLSTPLDGQMPQQLPSPQELKGKILLKAKKIGGLENCLDETLTDEVSDEEEMANDEAESLSAGDPPAGCVDDNKKKSKSKLSRELSDLVVYCKSVHFHGFEYARSHSKCYEMSSLSESKAKRLAKEAGTDFVQHNARQLSRIYPSGLRTDSSNYNPQDMWNVGCQIVALNFQTAGLEMDLNDGLFRQNHRCGYILKPDFMREGKAQFSPEKPGELQGYTPLRLSIQVISGQQLPKVNQKEGSIVDPLVRVEIYGVPQDQAKEETSHINNNGFNPLWNETLNFIIHAPELALVRFVVEDYDKASRNDFIGQFTLPFTCIQAGFRHIHLLSRDGTAIPPSSLFVNISISELT